MIQVRTDKNETRLLPTYNDVCEYLNRIERRKASETGENVSWCFLRRRYETLAIFYYRTPPLKKDFFTQKEKEAVEKETGLIEIMKGSPESLVQVLLTPNIDLEPLRKDWCQEYCKEHDMKICELVEKYQ